MGISPSGIRPSYEITVIKTLDTADYHNIVNQLYVNKKTKTKQKIIERTYKKKLGQWNSTGNLRRGGGSGLVTKSCPTPATP